MKSTKIIATCASLALAGLAVFGTTTAAAADEVEPAPITETVEAPAPAAPEPAAEVAPTPGVEESAPVEPAPEVALDASEVTPAAVEPEAPVLLQKQHHDDTYVVAAWRMPSYVDDHTATWPQSLANQGASLTVKNLSDLDAWLDAQCGAFQIDGYVEGETTTALLAGGVLLGENNPTEALWGGGWGEAYKVVNATGGCQPEVHNTVCEVPAAGPTSTDLADLWSNVDTRADGHIEYVENGLHIWTTSNGSAAKVSEGYPASFDLKNTGTLDLDWTGSTPPPGVNLFVTFEDGKTGTLVYESVYGQDLWLTNGSNADVKANAPVNGGGNGSQWHGTIDQWLSVYPNAHVNGIAYSLGSGVLGDGVINSITAGCTTYTFDKVATIEVTPPLVVVENGAWTGSPKCGETEFEQTRTVTTTTTTYHVEVVEGAYVNVADEPTVVVGEPETRTVEIEATPCPVTVVTPPTSTPSATPAPAAAVTPAAGLLASTGFDAAQWMILFAGLVLVGGAALLLVPRIASPRKRK